MKKTLLVAVTALLSFMTTQAQLTEGFDAATFPPTGWINAHTTGPTASAVWERATAGAFGGDLIPDVSSFFVDPHSGAGMASFRSWDFTAGNGANLITSVVNLSTGAENVVSFWMYRDNTYTNPDSINVYVNTTQSATGATLLGTVHRKRSLTPVEAGPNGWYQYQFTIPASFNTATNYIIFSAGSGWGNNMFIDDVFVGAKPTCGIPTAITTSNFNLAAATITATWTAPALGTPQGYEYAVNTTGINPASGTVVGGTTANVTGLTTGVVNYIFVRTNCGGGNYSAWTSVGVAALPCAGPLVPANAATNVPQNQQFSWPAVTGATTYSFHLGLTAGNEVNLGELDETHVEFNTLLPLTTYYWYVVPVINGVSSPAVCVSQSFTMAAEAATPPNNICSGAVTITGANIPGNPITSTTANATISLDAEECQGLAGAADDDVWFEFSTNSVAPSGIMTITPATNGIFDIVAQIYASNDCNNLGNPVACLDTSIDDGREQIDLSALAPNTHYFMRVYSFTSDIDDRGGFTIELSAGSTVPVQISSFTARRSNGVNIITWTTQQEINTKHFIIERSNDGINFTAIGQVAAAGNSNSARNYIYTDQRPARGNNYYRLRTFDLDNSSKLSDTRRVRNDGVADISVYPNPVSDKVTLDVNADKATRGSLVILDVSGKAVYSRAINIPVGNTILPVQVDRLSAGSYIMKIQLEEDVIIKQFNKQ